LSVLTARRRGVYEIMSRNLGDLQELAAYYIDALRAD
jgi:hypothetical protein